MQTHIKQRLVGAGVVLAIVVAFLLVLFYRSLSQQHVLHGRIPASPQSPVLVYDLPLQGQKVTSSDTLDTVNESDLRARAATTAAVSARILHTKPAKIKENLKEQQHAALPAAEHSTRDRQKNQVSWQRSEAALPPAWVVQLASFTDAAHAQRLVQGLRSMGLDVYAKSVVNEKADQVIRVYVGPYIQYDKVKVLQAHLHQKLHLNGIIKKYTL